MLHHRFRLTNVRVKSSTDRVNVHGSESGVDFDGASSQLSMISWKNGRWFFDSVCDAAALRE
jgi:hypothetical protein